MSLTSKAQQYDVLVKELFELLERTEESDSGSLFRAVQISCCREQDRLRLNKVLLGLKHTLEDWG